MASLVISVSAVSVLSCEQTHIITDAVKRLSHATIVGVGKYIVMLSSYCREDPMLCRLSGRRLYVSGAVRNTVAKIAGYKLLYSDACITIGFRLNV